MPLSRLPHPHLDDLLRTVVLAQAAADTGLLAGLLVVGEREDPSEAVRVRALDVRIADRHRLAEEVPQRDAHRPTDGAHELPCLSPEPRRRPVAVIRHRDLAPRPPIRSPAAGRALRAAGASRRSPGSDPRGSARKTSAPT